MLLICNILKFDKMKNIIIAALVVIVALLGIKLFLNDIFKKKDNSTVDSTIVVENRRICYIIIIILEFNSLISLFYFYKRVEENFLSYITEITKRKPNFLSVSLYLCLIKIFSANLLTFSG